MALVGHQPSGEKPILRRPALFLITLTHNTIEQFKQVRVELILLAVVFLPILIWYGSGDVDNDEAIYSFAAQKMVETGDWLTPVYIFHGNPPFLEKPPLKMWLTALTLELGAPENNWGLRLVDLVMTALTFVYLFLFARRIGGRWAGVFAGVVFFTMKFPFLNSGMLFNKMESVLVLQYTAGLYHFAAWTDEESRKRFHITAIGVYFVIGFMSKFVAALFMPLIMLIVIAFNAKLLKRFLKEIYFWLLIGFISAILIIPWFLYQYDQYGFPFWHSIFGMHVVKRLTSYLDVSHLQPWNYYLLFTNRIAISTGIYVSLFAGLYYLGRSYFASRDPKIAIVFIWFILPVTLISIMTSKLHAYIYPFFPPLAVVCGVGLAKLLTETSFGRVRYVFFAIALAPVAASYFEVVNDLKTRPSFFTTLTSCLGQIQSGSIPVAFFNPTRPANHVFRYYGFSDYLDADLDVLDRTLFGNDPAPAWLPESFYQQAVSADSRFGGVEAYRMPIAVLIASPSTREPAVLLLPDTFSGCGDEISLAGATQVQ